MLACTVEPFIDFCLMQFAIRPNLRNHNTLSRDKVIKQIASLVGHPHTVDLKNYELLIIVEVYQVCFTRLGTPSLNPASALLLWY